MDSLKISVLTPVYNVESYLHKCIDSILAQTLKDFELILVDDGSTDSSSKICDEYAAKDSRVRVYHRSNHGISVTREFALSQATGEFIQFIDSDDWIEPNMFELMYNKAKETSSDIVGCLLVEHWPHKDIHYKTYYKTKDAFIRDIISSKWGVLWKHLFKREMIVKNDIHIPINIDGGEDYVFCVKSFLNAGNVACVNNVLYHYNRLNITSTMNNMTRKKVQDQIDATEMAIAYMEDKGVSTKYKYEIDNRKFFSKSGLKKISLKEWVNVYPESNYIHKETPWGRDRFKMWFNIMMNIK